MAEILGKTAQVGVIGLGYVGLPLLRAFISAGYSTWGFDVDQRKIDALNEGNSYIAHVPGEWVADWLAKDQFRPTSDMRTLSEPDVLVICVPTPLNENRDPDLQYVENTAKQIARTLRLGQLVVLESTTYPGTTRDVLLPILEESGLQVGRDFFLAYSPEREDPGNPDFTMGGIPKVVGGVDQASLQLADSFYQQAVVSTVPVSNCEVAEAAKILENTYRCVNIAMVNELKILFGRLGIDVWEVIDAAKTKPFGFQAFYPGPGLGGHCIPIDPFYLSWLARRCEMPTRFIELAGEINSRMPSFVIERVAEALNSNGKPVKGSHIALLGAAYKRDVDDARESPTFKLMEILGQRGADLTYNDPHIAEIAATRHYNVPALKSQSLTAAYLSEQDCVIIATDHSAYNWEFIVENSQLIVDTRNAIGAAGLETDNVWKA